MYQDPNLAVNPFAANANGDQQTLQGMSPWGGSPSPAGGMGQPPQQVTPQNYPTYPNSYGLGSQNPNGSSVSGTTLVTNGASGPTFSTEPVSVQTPDTTSRGMNPWSLMGEANSRESGGSKGT